MLVVDHFRNLSTTLKLELATINKADKYTAEEVAYVLEDLLDAIE